MLIDARTVEDRATLHADICIVGAGAAGITLALELDGRPISVLLLESGGISPDPATRSLNAGETTGIAYDKLDAARSRYLGGSTNCWGGWCRPLDELDFAERDWMPNSGWPFGRERLESYYARAHDYLAIGPFDYSVEGWRADLERDRLKLFPLRNGGLTSLLCQLSPPARFGQLYRERLTRSGNVRTILNANVAEIETDHAAAKVTGLRVATLEGNTLAVKARLFVLAAGGIENARLLLLSNKVQSCGLGNRQDVVGRYFMDHPRLKSHNVRLVDEAAHRGLYDNTFAFVHRRYGRSRKRIAAYVAPTPEAQRAMALPNSRTSLLGRYAFDMSKAYLGLKAVRSQLVARNRYGYPMSETAREILSELPGIMVQAPLAGIGVLDAALNLSYVKRTFTVETVMEPVPNPDSRVTLTGERDRLGQNRVRLDWQLTELDRLHYEATVEMVTGELVRCGIVNRVDVSTRLFETWPQGIAGCWHHMGTTRMSTDPGKGVVDPDCRVHDMANLYCAGSSVFPSVGSDFPTITLVALAIRLADRLTTELDRTQAEAAPEAMASMA